MTPEEKAKAYDKALKVIKGNLDALNEITETGAETVNIQAIKNCFYKAFPELTENESKNEDERIRRVLCDIVQELYVETELCAHGLTVEKTLAYLEKQKEQKPINNTIRGKIISRATSEKQVVLISESSGKAEIGWDTRSLEDTKKLLEYGLAFINRNITNPTEKQTDYQQKQKPSE